MSNWQDQWEVVDASQEPLGGGQGSVVQVRHSHDGRAGALKRLHDRYQRSTEHRYRMQQEVNALLALGGKGAPEILDSNASRWQDQTVPLWAVMEWIPGRTLQQRVNNSPLPLDNALRVTEQLLMTVDECHKLDIHHRDLKHDNVILRDGDLRPILVDFGIVDEARVGRRSSVSDRHRSRDRESLSQAAGTCRQPARLPQCFGLVHGGGASLFHADRNRTSCAGRL